MAIITRAGKGAPLTWNEVDNNFEELNTTKQSAESGKGLSQENYTTTEKNKLAGLSNLFKGSFTTEANLISAFSVGQVGWEAQVDAGVGTDVVKYIWDNTDGVWVKGGGTGASTFADLTGSPDDNALLLAKFNTKQPTLVSGDNIKTVNGQSLVGPGDITGDAKPSGQIPSFKQYGAVGNGIVDDTDAIADAIAANDTVFDNGDFLVTVFDNKKGVEILGNSRILKQDPYIKNQINTYADKHQRVFGEEYLSSFHKKMLANMVGSPTNLKVRLSGDSTSGGSGASSPSFYPFNILASLNIKNGIRNVQYEDGSHGGQNTTTWLSTYLATDMAAGMDIYILRWGINDSISLTPTQFLDNIDIGLTTLRSDPDYTRDKLAIILQSQSTTTSTDTGQKGQIFNEAVNNGLRALARKHFCCFMDIYAMFQDGVNGQDYLEPIDPGLPNQQLLHPRDVFYVWICNKIFNVLYPNSFITGLIPNGGTAGQALTKVNGDDYNLQWASANSFKDNGERDGVTLSSTLITAYQVGVTVERVSTSFPCDGILTTHKSSALGGLGSQTLIAWGGTLSMYVRGGYYAAWNDWKQVTLI